MPKKDELSKSVKDSSAITPLFADETAVVLTKESTEKQIKSYFEGILALSQSVNDFPVSLDDVWALAYAEKGKAVRALKANFIEGVDFCLSKMKSKNNSLSQNPKREVFAQNGKNLFNENSLYPESLEQPVSSQNAKNLKGGRPTESYYLSIPCLEYFIARKVRPVFEVYRQVFHKVVTGTKEEIFTESEVKKYMLAADKSVKDALAKASKLESRVSIIDSQFKAAMKLYEEELTYKCNLVAFLFQKGLFQEWEKHYQSLK